MSYIQIQRYAGLCTWALVGFPVYLVSLPAEQGGDQGMDTLAWLGLACWALFGLCFWLASRALGQRRVTLADHAMLVVMSGSAIGVSYAAANGLGSVLLMLAACVLPWVMSLRAGLVWMLVGQLVMVPVFISGLGLVWYEAIMQSLLYTGFAGLVYANSFVARQQAQAREDQRRLNSELRATRALLAESVRINERTRISRELHDLLGHHLTALSLNLEVANHLVEGKAQEHVSQAHTLAKLLLSDVREAVSRIRDSDAIDMSTTLQPLTDNVPGLDVDMRMPTPFMLDDAERAHVLLRCTQEIITNVVRHAQATTLALHYRWHDQGVELSARDNGRGADDPAAGNGLRGMRERLAAYGGDVEIDTRPGEGFALRLYLPLAVVAVAGVA
jgi:signal transduction histidine kinase